MSVIRAFIAIDLPDDIRTRLVEVSETLQADLKGIAMRWVPVSHAHLTLKFLGDVSVKNVEIFKKILDTVTAKQEPFEISAGTLGVFPNVQRPRIIWAGVEAVDELCRIQRRIESEVDHLGYAPEDREFFPHITLGRLSRNAAHEEVRLISEYLKKEKVGFLGAGIIHHVHLYRSDLRPEGAVYTRLFSASLGGKSS